MQAPGILAADRGHVMTLLHSWVKLARLWSTMPDKATANVSPFSQHSSQGLAGILTFAATLRLSAYFAR